jgi:hypothetical protein
MPRAATPGTLGALGIARIVSRHAAAADLPEDRGCRTAPHLLHAARWVGGSTPERTIAPGETVRVSFVDGNPELVEQVQALQPLQVVVEYQDVVREHTWSAQVLLAHRDAGWHARGGVKTKLGRTERTVSLGQAG